jgi:hypothetical protein
LCGYNKEKKVTKRKFWWCYKGRKRVYVEKENEDRQREKQERKTTKKDKEKDNEERQ